MHSKPEKEMAEEELKKKENDRKHFHSYRDANKDGYIDRVMKMTPFCNFNLNYPPMKQKGWCHLVCVGWNLPSNFPDLEKVWKLEIKCGKMVKSLEFFLKRHQVLYKWNFVHFGQISNSFLPVCVQRIMKRLCSCIFLRSLLITYSITLVWKKKLLFTILTEKSLEKVLNFGSKNLYKCCLCEEARSRTKNILHNANCNNRLLKVNAVSQSKPHTSDYQFV